jgi:hypothetical protein
VRIGDRHALLIVVISFITFGASSGFAQGIDATKLRGIVIDEEAAQYVGKWTHSTNTKPFVNDGYHHDGNADKGAKSAKFSARVPADGDYQVLFAYTHGSNRATNTPVTIESADGKKSVTVNQKKSPPLGGFIALGQFRFLAAKEAVIEVSNAGTNGHVIVDAVQIVTLEEFKLVQSEAKKPAPVKIAQKKPEKKTPPAEPAPQFQRQNPEGVSPLESQQLDALLAKHLGDMGQATLVGDEVFLRRVTLDLVGRQPTVDELEEFLADDSSSKRTAVVDRLLASQDYGRNWGNYWSDVIGSRQQEPQLTFHDYRPFKSWLAEQFNSDRKWDEMVFDMLTAQGKVGENPAGTFIAFHQANANRLAGETSRVFLSTKIHCAECHDHPFADIPMETFHGMAAFFVRAEAKIPHNESSQIELKSKTKGEHKIPGRKEEMIPVALHGQSGSAKYETGTSDLKRRALLAQWTVDPNNPYFARAYVNRVWARMMGRGFYEPVDDMGDDADGPILEDVHEQLAGHFISTGFDHKSVMRLIVNTKAYQRSIVAPSGSKQNPLVAARTKQLRGDEVFDSLVTAVELENVRPEKAKPTGAIRFPIPPKSTRDLVNDAFGYDPSFKDELLVRSMKQAMFMMNNVQLQKQIDADPKSDTYLARLVGAESDNTQAAIKLYRAVLARTPNETELGIVLAHVKRVSDRGEAFEDILWSLINSAEFTTRR